MYFARNTVACCLFGIQWNMASYEIGTIWNESGTTFSQKNSCKPLLKRYFLMFLLLDASDIRSR